MRLLTILILCFFSSPTSFAQGEFESQAENSSVLKSNSFAYVNSDSIYLSSVTEPIPKITGWDIGGQLALSLLSGTVLSIGGALVGEGLSSGSYEYFSPGAAYGFLIGYSLGTSIGVYAAASGKKYNPNLLVLIGSSVIGEIVGIYILEKLGAPGWPSLLLPPLFSIITLNAFQQKKSNITVGFDVQQLPQPNAYSYRMKLQYEF